MIQTFEEFKAGILARAKHNRRVKRMPYVKSTINTILPDIEVPPTELEEIEQGV